MQYTWSWKVFWGRLGQQQVEKCERAFQGKGFVHLNVGQLKCGPFLKTATSVSPNSDI